MKIFRSYKREEFLNLLGGRELIPLKEVDTEKHTGCLAKIDLYKIGTVQMIFAGVDKLTNKFVIHQVYPQ